MEQLDYMSVAAEALKQIQGDGAFLTVAHKGTSNTMTIGWALFGCMWRKPVLTVAVRPTRHTFGIIEQSADFTVSVPTADMRKALQYCGSRSGRDGDKFSAAQLTTAPALKTGSPIITLSGLQFECVILHKTPMSAVGQDSPLNSLYPQKDFHTLYYGEVVACYRS